MSSAVLTLRNQAVHWPNAVWSANKGQNVPSIHDLCLYVLSSSVILSQTWGKTIPKRLILSNISIKMCPHFWIPMNTNRANNIKSTICWNSPDQDAFLKCQQFSDSQTAFCNSNPFNNRKSKGLPLWKIIHNWQTLSSSLLVFTKSS